MSAPVEPHTPPRPPGMCDSSRRERLRAAAAAWPALALYLGTWPAALAQEWTAVWLFFFSGTVLAVTLSRAQYMRARARELDCRQPAPAQGAAQ